MQFAIADPRTPESAAAGVRFIEAHGLDASRVVWPAHVDTDEGTVYGHVFDLDEQGQRIYHEPTAAYFKTPFEVPLTADPADYGLSQWMEALT